MAAGAQTSNFIVTTRQLPIVVIGGVLGFSRDRALEEGTELATELATLLKRPCRLLEKPVGGWHTDNFGVARALSLAKAFGLKTDTQNQEIVDMDPPSKLADALRSGNLRKQLWAATFGGGYGKQALPALEEFSVAIDDARQQGSGSQELELFLGRGIVSMAHIAHAAGETLDASDRQLVLRTMEQLATDTRVEVLWHLLYAIEIFGMMSEPNADSLKRYLSDGTTPGYVSSKIEDVLKNYAKNTGKDMAPDNGGASAD